MFGIMEDNAQKLRILLGKRIRSLRTANGWTQQELGDKANINYKFIGEIERGNQNPTFGLLVKIADAFKIELMELFRLSHEMSSRKDLEKELNKILKNASEDELRQSLLLLKALFPKNR